jgi:hypothetical protein
MPALKKSSLFRALLVEVAAPTHQTKGVVAKLLAVITLRKTILSFTRLYPDCNVAEAWQSENFL